MSINEESLISYLPIILLLLGVFVLLFLRIFSLKRNNNVKNVNCPSCGNWVNYLTASTEGKGSVCQTCAEKEWERKKSNGNRKIIK